MHILRSMIVGLLGLVATIPVAAEEPNKEREKLLGTWLATEGVYNGKPLTKEQVQRSKIIYSSGKKDELIPPRMTLYPPTGDGKKAAVYDFEIDPNKKPRQISGSRLEGFMRINFLGIYSLEGDTLKLCLAFWAIKPPKQFASPPGSDYLLLTLKRAK